MTSKNPDDALPSENDPKNNSSENDQSPEAIAAAAIEAAKQQAAGEDPDSEKSSNTDDDASTGGEALAEGTTDGTDESHADDDPLGFDDARMPEEADESVDLSAADNEDGTGTGTGNDLEAQLAAANAKADEHWNRVLRMQADLENERKRTQKQVSNAHKFAIEGFVNELLPIKDSLEMGLQAAKAEDADLIKIVEGSELTLKLLAQAFEKNHINEVDPMDEKFDPNVHQAMSMQEAEGKAPNTVIGVMQKGYTLNDRLIRPALVTVSK